MQGVAVRQDQLFAVDQSAAVIVNGKPAHVYDTTTHMTALSDEIPPGVELISENEPWLVEIEQVCTT